MKVKNCGICQLFPLTDPLLETRNWVVVLAQDQGYLGRCYVSLKDHKRSMAELTNEEWLDFAQIVKSLEQAIRLAFDARLFNWSCLMNNAFQHNPATPHVHWHFRPRYDKTVSIDGIDFEDPLFGHHYDREQSLKVSGETLSHIQAKIKENLK